MGAFVEVCEQCKLDVNSAKSKVTVVEREGESDCSAKIVGGNWGNMCNVYLSVVKNKNGGCKNAVNSVAQ